MKYRAHQWTCPEHHSDRVHTWTKHTQAYGQVKWVRRKRAARQPGVGSSMTQSGFVLFATADAAAAALAGVDPPARVRTHGSIFMWRETTGLINAQTAFTLSLRRVVFPRCTYARLPEDQMIQHHTKTFGSCALTDA